MSKRSWAIIAIIILLGAIILSYYSVKLDTDTSKDGMDDEYRGGTGIYIINNKHIVIKNFDVRHVEDGIWVKNSENISIENCHAGNCFAGGYSGRGIILQVSKNCTLEDCTVVNAGAQGITLSQAENCIVRDCTITSDPSGGIGDKSTDYYIVVGYSYNNLIEGCTIGNFHDRTNAHVGHGFIIKDTRNDVPWEHSNNNIWRNCVALTPFGETFAAAHMANNNSWIDCSLMNTIEERNGFGIVARNGANHNYWENITISGISNGIYFNIVPGEGKEVAPTSNLIRNAIIQGADNAFTLNRASNSNTLENGVIYDATTLVLLRRGGYRDLTIKNSILQSINSTEFSELSGTIDSLDITYSCFYDNDFPMTIGVGNIEADPRFVNPVLGDFHLRSGFGRWDGAGWISDSDTSPCIDKGDPNDDYFQEPQPNGGRINMGFHGGTPKASKSTSKGEHGDIKPQVNTNIKEPTYPKPSSGLVYYVSTKGNDENSGSSEQTAWRTLEFASSQANAGDTIYVKAGDYGFDKIYFPNSGNQTHPIYFIGYNTKPNDDPTKKFNMPIIDGEKDAGQKSSARGDITYLFKSNGLLPVNYFIEVSKQKSIFNEIKAQYY
jgi:parallel beta-helix repeat protein